jgi:alpha 1,3-glucosidase
MITRGGDGAFTDPYRLFNLDTFEYLADSEMGIYGSIPFMHAQKSNSTVAIFSLTGSETWVDITKTSKSTQTHWMSETGTLDLFVFLGPSSDTVFENYAQLTGTTALPQMFAIGHHQCRWNYLNEEDVKEVSRKFDEYDIPMDVIWLDIEYAKEVGCSLTASKGSSCRLCPA